MSSPFDLVSSEAIEDGTATDAYFLRTEAALDHAGKNPNVTAEVSIDPFPTGTFSVFSGIKDVAHLLSELPVDADALRAGRLFDGGPVLRIEGPYRAFARYETSILGFLSEASAFATAALEARLAAPNATVLSFGARHRHPSVAAVLERSALSADFDGFSHVAAGDVLDREAGGTMPHSLLICFGRGQQQAAWRAFDAATPATVPRIALVDTYEDEVAEAIEAAEALGDSLDGVRIDTTSSRRGDLRQIVREVKWELSVRDLDHIDVFVSGGLEPMLMARLRDVADGFGVGSHITDAAPLDFGLDIVSVDGKPAAKRGKLSGKKQVYRTPDGGHRVGLAEDDGSERGDALLKPLVRDGEIVTSVDLDSVAERCRTDAKRVGFREDAPWRD